jgi:hypothetical protein
MGGVYHRPRRLGHIYRIFRFRFKNFFPEFGLVSARLPHQPKADFQNKKFSFNCFKKNRVPLQKGNGKFFGFELR